jgi:putative endonuclease
MRTYWVYMLLCADGSFYVGVTNNLEFRLGQHEFGVDRHCYTFTRRPLVLVHSSDFQNVNDAIAWEKQLKGWSRAKKQALVEGDWPLISRLAQNYGERVGHPSTGSG